MCEICLKTPCANTCPNSDVRPVCVCVSCGFDIYEDEKIYKIDGEIWCESCIDDCVGYAQHDCDEWDD